MNSSPVSPYATWFGGPWNGLKIKAPPANQRVVEMRPGRYVRVGQGASGCPYYCWTGTSEQPDQAVLILRSVRDRFGRDGLQLLMELSEGLGLEKAEQAVRRLL